MSEALEPPTYEEALLPSSSSAERSLDEQILHIPAAHLPLPQGEFIVSSNNGHARLRLSGQEEDIELPVYGIGGEVSGIVELAKTDSILSVDVTVEGRIKVHELGEGGQIDTPILLGSVQLWTKADNASPCPSTFSFSVTLPRSFESEGKTYPLPPSHSAQLKGVPGFDAGINYWISVSIKSKKFGLAIGGNTLSTPFIYYPRTSPVHSLPAPLEWAKKGFTEQVGWKAYTYAIKTYPKSGLANIIVKLYVPASRAFWVSDSIPFHISFESESDKTITEFQPFGPAGALHATRLQLIRQSTSDVRGALVHNTKTNIWRTDSIGEGIFGPGTDGATWLSFSGHIPIEPVKVTGFSLRHFSVTDGFVLTVTPPDVTKSPFIGIRETIAVRLATDPWLE
ncbi:hypothetical protein R3P38DRAFT_2843477 [Favolaschia claudopus]|uniref:Arrestin-like N-terminal domain-containing protein n=1 Tax=Favolaschia claudopus TaxID=2862362 RepID=A0AAW0DYK9_9AGAR